MQRSFFNVAMQLFACCSAVSEKMTSALQKSECCSTTSAAQLSKTCSAIPVFACGMLQRMPKGGGKKAGGGFKTSRGDPPRKAVSDPSPRYVFPPPPYSIPLIKSLKNPQNLPQVATSEAILGGSPNMVCKGPSSRGLCFPPPPHLALSRYVARVGFRGLELRTLLTQNAMHSLFDAPPHASSLGATSPKRNFCDGNRHMQESPHPRAPKSPKSLKKVFPWPPCPECQRSVEKVPKRTRQRAKKVSKSVFGDFGHFFDTPSGEAWEDLFESGNATTRTTAIPGIPRSPPLPRTAGIPRPPPPHLQISAPPCMGGSWYSHGPREHPAVGIPRPRPPGLAAPLCLG